MPELPEVATTIKYLQAQLLDKTIKSVAFPNQGHTQLNAEPTAIINKLVQARLQQINRVGKWMLFEFNQQGNAIKFVGHLRMSGRFLVADQSLAHPHTRMQWHLDSDEVVYYIDQRRFGTWHLVTDFADYPSLQNLGVDALSADFNAAYLASKLKKLKKPIYSALLDQSVVAGLGNIYVNEILHAAGIHPLALANTLSADQTSRIVEQTKQILELALSMKGTTLIDNLYAAPEGSSGEFYKLLQVYGKKHDANIDVIKIGGRSVFVHKGTKL
jgi:formamidopyrimidine-DNA glycosylase